MSKREDKKQKNEKKESELVTKESLCAVCALFSLLALLILFTNEWIFGDIGGAIHGFLTGVLGYCAYPVFLATLYLSFTSLLDKRFIKNRKATAYIVLTVISVALLLHTAFTFSWSLNGYLSACFNAGENFPNATVCGFIGALPVLALASATTKIGAIIIFAMLAGFFGYLSFILLKKNGEQKTDPAKQTAQTPSVTPVEIPLSSVSADQPVSQPISQPISQPVAQVIPQTVAEESAQGQAVSERYAFDGVDMPQRPAFTLSDETPAQPQSAGFSPFSASGQTQPQSVATDREAYERSREYLFGATPDEIYRKNLIFDPNSRANNLPPFGSGASVSSSAQGGYTPSYVDAYQTSVNDGERPTKIFEDRTFAKPAEEITPLQPIQPPTVEQQPTLSYPTYPTERTAVEEPPVIPVEERSFSREEFVPTEDTREYEREDIDLFSREEMRGYERDSDSLDTGLDTGLREETYIDAREEFLSVEDTPVFEEEQERGRSRGIDIFDEEEDDPYTLRSEFDGGRDLPPAIETDRFGGFEREERQVERVERTVEPIIEPIAETPAPAPQKPTPPPPPKPRVIRPYVRVPLDDFDCRDVEPTQNPQEVEEIKANIIATLEDFKVTGAAIASVTHGPTVTRYNVTIPRNISPKKVVALDDPIAISLHSSGVNIYPNFDDGVVSIEVPNKNRQFVQLGCMLTGDTFVNAKSSSLMFTMGKDVGNRKVYGDISKMIHMLVAGSSGSGKSVFLGSLIISLIYKYSPEELRLILIDPKKTEFVLYNDLPHLMINEIITDAHKAVQSLNWAIGEMNRRYGLFEQMSRAGTYVVNLDQYNQHVEKAERLPKIVMIIDELADLMLAAKKEVEDRIQNLTQKARAAGIHLVVATQRPSTDVITGVIKSNLNTRIAFAVATDVDSRVILDQSGAQKLLGKGDFLYTMQGINTPIRVQSAFISPEDSQRVVNFIKSNNEAYYDESATAYINNVRAGGEGGGGYGGSGDEVEPVYIDALRCVILSNSASISLIQRKCSIGYNKAGKIVEWMEEMGYISSFDGAKARKVLITKEEFESKYGEL